ncbi:MAG: glucose-6-phosphate isomerase [Planctomycetota bacterium]
MHLTINYASCFDDRVGAHGLTRTEFAEAGPGLRTLTERLEDSRGTGWERWRLLAEDPVRSEHVHAVRALVDQHRATTDNLVVLGIGGSALGNIALQAALNPVTYNLMPREERGGPRLFVLDNVDPHLVGQTLAEIRRDDPEFKRTVVNVVSKSGETAETAAQFMITRSMLRNVIGPDAAKKIVAITDSSQGTMRSICDAEGYATLPVPDGVGGRFSVMSPVGLFSAAMCGIDIDALLDGANAMEQRCRRDDVLENPAAVLAWLLMTFTERGKSNHVMMPYANQLYLLADWFRQLWAESLGKEHATTGEQVFAGATPIKALGTTDQHSQVQLYREGPNDKVFGFIEVGDFDTDVTIPGDLDVDALRYLHGQSLGTLLQAEKRATEFAFVESQRPNFTMHMPRINAYHVGEFIMLWEMVTAYAGLMLNIDAYDQPAVETGKKATFGLMGRDGYDDWKAKVNGVLTDSDATV